MALRKPSDFFEDTTGSAVDESTKSTEVSTYSDAFKSFKNNLGKIDDIAKFSESLEGYNQNIERVNYLSKQLSVVQDEIKTLLTKEDLDRAMMAQLLVVEQTTNDIQSRVKTINDEIEIR